MLVINASLLNFSNMVIGIISLEMLFPSSIVATMIRFRNFMSHENLFYIKAYRHQNLMMTYYTNSKRLLLGVIFLTSFEK